MNALNTVFTSATTQLQARGRVRFACLVRVSGTDPSGSVFEDEVRTEVLTPDGALFISTRSLTTGSEVAVTRDDKQARARVLGQVGLIQDEEIYAFQFIASNTLNFWDIAFSLHRDSNAAPVNFQCSRCSRQQELQLGEIEIIVFEKTRTISHRCEQCAGDTLWVEPTLEADNGLITGSGAYQQQNRQESAPGSRANNRRKHVRVAMKNGKACLRRAGFNEDDIVRVLDLSRGGIRFLSSVDYRPGTEISVAVPFNEGGANLFSNARIIRVQNRPHDGVLGEYGLQYTS